MAAARRQQPGSVSAHHRGGFRGRWRYVDEDGRAQRVEVYGTTEDEAWTRLDEVIARVSAGEPAKDSRGRVRSFVELYVDGPLAASERAQSTKDLYALLLRGQVVPVLGDKRIGDVRPSDVERVFARQRELGQAGSTRRSTYAAMRGLFDAAVADELLRSNPVAKVKRPNADSSRPDELDGEQLARVLAATGEHRTLAALVPLCASTGLGRGEALGLLWSDVDLDAGLAHVERQLVRSSSGLTRSATKTKTRARTVPLPGVVVERLRQHRARQAADRLRAGAGWSEHGLVFATQLGEPLDPCNVSRAYRTAVEPLGLPAGLHALRHTAATAMLRAGTDVRSVADVLGHSNPSITLAVYSHSNTDSRRAAVNAAAALLDGSGS